MASAGSALWLIYGIMLDEVPIIVANAVFLFFTLTTLFVTLKYR
jgi:MtN3 and saliva related transmembrane protein